MKYHIITKYGNYQIEAEDFEDALNQVYRGVKEAEMNDIRDCNSEYDLTEEDLHNLCLCDFFKHK